MSLVTIADLPAAAPLAGSELVPVQAGVNTRRTTTQDVANLAVMYQLPAGLLLPYAGGAVLPGFLECDGAAVSRAGYAALFAAIGTTWGPGDGVTTFNLPDLRDRAAIGTSPGGLGADRPTARAVGDAGGEETHTLTTPELAAHAHGVTDPGHNHAYSFSPPGYLTAHKGMTPTLTWPAIGATAAQEVPPSVTASQTNVTIDDEGGDEPHNNMQPFASVLWLIKV